MLKCFTAHNQTHTKCIRCFYRVLVREYVFRWFSAIILTFPGDKKQERLCTTQHWPGSVTQNRGDIAEHPDGGSFRAAQNYIETYYLQLKATQVSVIHTTQLLISQQPTQQGKELSGSALSPIPFCKTHYLALCDQKRQNYPVHVNKKEQSERQRENKILMEKRKQKGQGKGTKRNARMERERISWKMRWQKAFYVQEGWRGNFQMSEISHLLGCKATLYGGKC